MKRSSERVLTTHVGSLCRPADVAEALRAREHGEGFEDEEFEKILAPAVADVVRRQADAGVDVPSDGEFGKSTWMGYISERLSGLEVTVQDPDQLVAVVGSFSQDMQDFAEFYEVYNRESGSMWIPPEEAFLPLAAPASVEAWVPNQHYPDDEAYLAALAAALHEEYQAVVDAGLILQLDDAFIPANYDGFLARGQSMDDYLRHCALRIEALNEALHGMPEDRVRYHICWGSWAGPHTTDVPLRAIVDLVLRVNAQAYAIEAANPRHEYEWRVWEDVKLPEGKILIPGVVTHSTNVVEHPETIAQRIERYALMVGRENVMAGTDCGFAQGWNMPRTHPTVQWAKLRALSEGARLASERLWS